MELLLTPDYDTVCVDHRRASEAIPHIDWRVHFKWYQRGSFIRSEITQEDAGVIAGVYGQGIPEDGGTTVFLKDIKNIFGTGANTKIHINHFLSKYSIELEVTMPEVVDFGPYVQQGHFDIENHIRPSQTIPEDFYGM